MTALILITATSCRVLIFRTMAACQVYAEPMRDAAALFCVPLGVQV